VAVEVGTETREDGAVVGGYPAASSMLLVEEVGGSCDYPAHGPHVHALSVFNCKEPNPIYQV
jgi:hypothetical protein